MHTETLALLTSLFFVLASNGPFWSALTTQGTMPSIEAGFLVFFTGLLLTGLHWLMLLLVINRWNAKPLLLVLLSLAATTTYFSSRYGVHIDKSMVRSIFETDVREARELLDSTMLPYLLGHVLMPGFLLWHVRIARTSFRPALNTRAASILAAVAMVTAGFWPVMNRLLPAFSEYKELRYLVTPSNFVVSSVRLLTTHVVAPASVSPVRETIAPDAYRIASAATRKPRAMVLVVGETARAANWGLSGYARQTTPELAPRDVLNYRHARSCGTDTATSIPCMFSVHGRQHYDEPRIRRSESLLHVLHRVGVRVLWRDNQSGCKGVCNGLPVERMSFVESHDLCAGGHCFDGVLLQGIQTLIGSTQGDVLIVLHMLGNHGPAYHQRYPSSFRRFTPTCDTTDLAACSQAALVNTYDNALLYTDHVLAELIDDLKEVISHDTSMLYVSDHGESLGENNLYLHGMPYAIAPDEQTHVPMVIWLSSGVAESRHLDLPCLARSAQIEAVSHDNLFHTLLSHFDVQTQVFDATLDLMNGCKR